MKTIIIAALSENRVIGRDNTIPWHYPADLKHFIRTTKGHPVVAGRKTYESFKVRPLPNRFNIILTRNPDYPVAPGVIVCRNIERVMDKARDRGYQKAVYYRWCPNLCVGPALGRRNDSDASAHQSRGRRVLSGVGQRRMEERGKVP